MKETDTARFTTLSKPGRPLPSLSIWLFMLIALLTAVPSAEAQESSGPVFGEVIDVRVVNLEVVVTKRGERVTGLKPEDFLLTVDGREVPIEYFTEVLGGTAVVRDGQADNSSLPALAPGAPVSTSYLLFIDEFFSVPNRRNQVLRSLIEQLPVLNPEDRMAIVAYNGRGVEMLTTWSQSVNQLQRVLEDALERPAFGLRRLSERRVFESAQELRDLRNDNLNLLQDQQFATRDARNARDPFFTPLLELEEEAQAELLSRQVERSVLAASSALRGFANPPGRKVMLLLSGGWPYNPAQWVAGRPDRAIYSTGIEYGDDLLEPLVETANRLSYTLYPVDVPTSTDTTADVGRSTVAEAQLSRNLLFDRIQDERASLAHLAGQTGGEPLYGAASFSALELASADTRSYYWLGFTPDWQGDDETHRINIRAKDRSLKVRTRKNYSDLSRKTEVTMMVESALLFGDLPAALPLGAVVGESEKAGWGKMEVPLSVVFPIDELTFLPYEGGWVAELELRVAVQDDEGNTADVPVIPLRVSMDEEPREGELRRYDTRLKLRRSEHDAVVSVYDVASGKIMTVRVAIDPSGAQRKSRG